MRIPVTRATGVRYLVPLLLFVAAFAVRLAYLSQLRHSPHFDAPIMDAAYHDEWARRIAAGDWVGDEVFFRAPLYPYFLGVLYRVFGPNPLAVRLVQFAIGALTCVLLYLLGRRAAGLAVGVLAGLMAALYGPLIYFEGELLLPVVEAFFTVAMLLCVSWALDPSRPPQPDQEADRPCAASQGGGWLRWLLVGLCCGLFAITRPNVLAFLPVFLGYLVRRLGWRNGLRSGLAVGFGTALCVFPVATRNYLVGGDLVLVSSQGGLNFYIGNNPQSDGTTAVIPGTRATWWGGYRDAVRIAEQEAGRRLRPSEVSAFWGRKALAFIASQPGAWLKLSLRKLLLFWHGFELPNNMQLYAISRFSPLMGALLWQAGPLCFPFGVVAPLGLVGAGLALAQRRQTLTPSLLFLATYSLATVAFFVCARYRVPCLPPLILLAAFALVEGARLLRQRRWRAVGPAVVGLLLAGLIANHDFYGLAQVNPAKAHTDFGSAYRSQGRLAEAEREFRLALRYEPSRAEHKLALADCLVAEKRVPEAKLLLADVLRASPHRPDALAAMGDALSQEGRFGEAAGYYRQAIAADPGDAQAYRGLGECLAKLGSGEEAARVYAEGALRQPHDEALQLAIVQALFARGDFGQAARLGEELLAKGEFDPDLAALVGSAYVNLGQVSRAQPFANAILRVDPRHVGGQVLLGVCLWQQGALDPAIRAFQHALAVDPGSVDAWSNLSACYAAKGDLAEALKAASRAIELDSGSIQARLVRAECYRHTGDAPRAAAECREILRRDPSVLQARQILDELQAPPGSGR